MLNVLPIEDYITELFFHNFLWEKSEMSWCFLKGMKDKAGPTGSIPSTSLSILQGDD